MTTINATGGTTAQNLALKAYEDKVRAQLQEAKAKLDLLDARARESRARAEINALSYLKKAKENIDQKLQDLKATHGVHVSRAKADIDAHVASLKASLDEITAKVKGQLTTK
jgi:F0F1-type ATP synthase membrane subunit b/b'